MKKEGKHHRRALSIGLKKLMKKKKGWEMKNYHGYKLQRLDRYMVANGIEMDEVQVEVCSLNRVVLLLFFFFFFFFTENVVFSTNQIIKLILIISNIFFCFFSFSFSFY